MARSAKFAIVGYVSRVRLRVALEGIVRLAFAAAVVAAPDLGVVLPQPSVNSTSLGVWIDWSSGYLGSSLGRQRDPSSAMSIDEAPGLTLDGTLAMVGERI